MIKFVCASCGERLSVSDQHAGRKGVCPNCRAANRIPLKGYAETGPRKGEARAARGAAAFAPLAPAEEEPRRPIAFEPPAESPDAALPGDAAVAEKGGSGRMVVAPSPSPEEPPEIAVVEGWRLPRPVKIALLILAAVAIVAAIYFALLLALHALVPRD